MTPEELTALDKRVRNAQAISNSIGHINTAIECVDKLKSDDLTFDIAGNKQLVGISFSARLLKDAADKHVLEYLAKIKATLKEQLAGKLKEFGDV